ncbi:MAG TPA: GNAT family N-acetyltransferase [Candidatus Acidoferrales bacterium]|nr:GNAT family N-acetyltransferase [Candidatus Acidoferrales bacterium]
MKVKRLDTDDLAMLVSTVRSFKGREISAGHAQDFLADPRHFVIVAETGGEPVGFLLAYRLERMDRPSAKMFIYEIEVAEAHRRKGMGTSLIGAIREIVRREGLMNAFVLTNHSNEGAVAFYKSTGGRIENGDDLMFVYPN